jgi:lysophospholipase L1-like esterase
MTSMRSALWLFILLLGTFHQLHGAKVVVIGDSLSAEYMAIPDFPGTDNPTDYARVTVPGWESMSWVEVLGRMRGEYFNFGRFRADLFGWQDLRFSGYEFNFAIPGFRAAQYEDIVNSSIFSNQHYLPFRITLQDILRNEADWVIIWLGANEFRANYGYLAEGGEAAPLIQNLRSDLDAVIRFVHQQRADLNIVLANIPDLGAAPAKQRDHPDPDQRALVTAATKQANLALAELADSKGIALADLYSQSELLLTEEPTFFGAVAIFNGAHPDNHPRFHFTRDGLHPNTPSQMEIARVLIETFNHAFQAGIPSISDQEALEFLGIPPDQPYFDWIDSFRASERGMEDDPDGDGLANIVEMALGLNPTVPDEPPIVPKVESGRLIITFTPDARHRRFLKLLLQHSEDLRAWTDLPATQMTENPDQSITARIPITGAHGFLRISVTLNPPQE